MRKVMILLSLLVAVPALAADQPEGTVITLSAEADTMLANDEVVALFRIEANGRKPAALRAEVNRVSQAVSARMKRERGVKLMTTSRRMEPVWQYSKISRKRERDGWHLIQDIRITSHKLEAVAEWLDDLEKAGAHVQSLSYRVSHARARKAQEELRQQAIRIFRGRAATTAKALDASSFRMMKLNTNSRMPTPVRRNMAVMAMSEAKAAPAAALEAGETRISVSVSGEILLPARDFPVR